jgi:UDP-N-acetylmuramoyl-L-alanyl-D-glutamate--2,6-diaminopimelate ligase
MKQLKDITGKIPILGTIGNMEREIVSLQFDSRTTEPGSLFVAVRGTVSDGHDYIPDAIERGAQAILCETMPSEIIAGITYIRCKDTHAALGEAASAFFDNPSGKLLLTGITGTNGKTTTVTLLQRLFRRLGFGSGLLSTIRNEVNEKELPAILTTPDPVQINKLLRLMVDEDCNYAFMEVSSHAADQKRISGLSFTGGVFTNITHDHLDYHQTFDHYLDAKKSFFDGLPPGAFALVNKDDRNGMVMIQNTHAAKFTYSLQTMADFRCRIIENQFCGLHLEVDGKEAWFHLIGTFNAYNLLAAYATAILLNQDPERILIHLSDLEPVNGRFNPIRSRDGVTAIIDYAHTPDALKSVLETIGLIRTRNEQLITVIGAGGNRDTAKRPVMAQLSCAYSDKVVLTSDNPRDEDPEAILAEMERGVPEGERNKVMVITNRREALRVASALAQSGDIILVAGKGHETFQEIRGVRYPFDDREVIQELFKHR